jgi:hypothetical protein
MRQLYNPHHLLNQQTNLMELPIKQNCTFESLFVFIIKFNVTLLGPYHNGVPSEFEIRLAGVKRARNVLAANRVVQLPSN